MDEQPTYGERVSTDTLRERLEFLRAGDEDELEFFADEIAELEKIENAGISDWLYGETLIRDDHFVEYAKELAEDIGAFKASQVEWPYTHIDWKAAAEELEQDYTEVELAGRNYFVRT